MLGLPIQLTSVDVAQIFYVPFEGWSHYMKYKWAPLINLPLPFNITRKFSRQPALVHRCRVKKREISPLHQLYFDVVHKIILQRKKRRTESNYLDMTLMELLDSKVKIDLAGF